MPEQATAPPTPVVAPIIHLNGDRAETLLDQLEAVYSALSDALAALRQAGPNGRNYYPEDGLLEKAIAQHQRRMRAITDMQEEIVAECDAINEQTR
jgi:hypothetical protein